MSSQQNKKTTKKNKSSALRVRDQYPITCNIGCKTCGKLRRPKR
jgi:hypothetical protein